MNMSTDLGKTLRRRAQKVARQVVNGLCSVTMFFDKVFIVAAKRIGYDSCHPAFTRWIERVSTSGLNCHRQATTIFEIAQPSSALSSMCNVS